MGCVGLWQTSYHDEDGLLKTLEEQVAKIKAGKARREAEAKKTVGQRVAESTVLWSEPNDCFHIMHPVTGGQLMLARYKPAEKLRWTREYIAAAIDKVRDDTIEECAKVADGSVEKYGPACGVVTYGRYSEAKLIRDSIRALKQ